MGGVQAFDGWELARELGLPVAREVRPVQVELPESNDRREISATGFAPARIEIPAIGVDASIEQIGIINGVMQTPENHWNVGWYQETSLAGGHGNAVFAAHRDWWNVGPVVFFRLNEVQIGDAITVTGAGGEQVTYIVTEAYSVAAGADFTPEISSNTGDEITLITCTGTWDGSTYTDRLIVRGVLA
jgi:LPXTG-site transpeptidase (sortase) family protein